MTFTEQNSVEHYIIYQLTGINLNTSNKIAETQSPYGIKWQYKSSQELNRGVNEVLEESELTKALIRLNPEIKQKPEFADEVIYKLRAIHISDNQVGLVK